MFKRYFICPKGKHPPPDTTSPNSECVHARANLGKRNKNLFKRGAPEAQPGHTTTQKPNPYTRQQRRVSGRHTSRSTHAHCSTLHHARRYTTTHYATPLHSTIDTAPPHTAPRAAPYHTRPHRARMLDVALVPQRIWTVLMVGRFTHALRHVQTDHSDITYLVSGLANARWSVVPARER